MEQSLQTEKKKRVIFSSCSTFLEWLPSWSWWENVSSSELPSMSSMKNDKWKERSSKILLFFSRFFLHHSQFASSHHLPQPFALWNMLRRSFPHFYAIFCLSSSLHTIQPLLWGKKRAGKRRKFIFLDSRTWELSTTTLNDIKYHECGEGTLLSSGMLCWTSSNVCARQCFQFESLWSQHSFRH